MSYDPEAPPADTQCDVVFREGQTLGGHVTHTPRLIIMDLKGGVIMEDSNLYIFLVGIYLILIKGLLPHYSLLAPINKTGSLRTLRQEGTLYDPGKDTSAVTW